jgi:hypothetical protein
MIPRSWFIETQTKVRIRVSCWSVCKPPSNLWRGVREGERLFERGREKEEKIPSNNEPPLYPIIGVLILPLGHLLQHDW